MIEKLSKLFGSIFRSIGKGFNFFFNNKNKAIRLTSIIFFCGILVTILGFCIKVFIYSDEAIKTATDGMNKTVKTVSDSIQKVTEEVKSDITFEREEAKPLPPDPSKNWEEKAVINEVKGSANLIIVSSEKAKKKFENIIKNGFPKSFDRKLNNEVDQLLKEQLERADNMFDIVKSNVGPFVERHIEDSSNKDIFVDYMYKELFTQETLDSFIAVTAIKLDNALMNCINEELDKQLRQIQLDTKNLTFEELKRRMPDAREICDSIYIKTVEKDKYLTGERKGQIAAYAEKLGKKHNMVSTGAILTVLSGFGSALSVTGAGALAISGVGLPIASIGVAAGFVLAGITALVGGTTAYSAASQAESEGRLIKFKKTMQEAVINTRDQFKKVVEKSVRDVITQYKNTKFFENAEIKVVADEPPINVDLKK